jgi:uncharacterized SAM-binding protein YcdF (DUF218 family)
MGSGPVREDVAIGSHHNSSVTPRRIRWKRWALVVATALSVWLARAPLLMWAGRSLDVSEPPRWSDYVLVLGGDHDQRPAVAAALYKAGLTGQILITVGRASPEVAAGLVEPDHEVVRRVLCARGVPDTAIILLAGPVDSTLEEAVRLGRFLEDHPGGVVTVVTSDYHTRRSRLLFQRVNLRGAGVHFVGAPTEGFDATNWWKSEDGCSAYLSEFVKLAAYSLGR